MDAKTKILEQFFFQNDEKNENLFLLSLNISYFNKFITKTRKIKKKKFNRKWVLKKIKKMHF